MVSVLSRRLLPLAVVAGIGLAAAQPREAEALTISLDFVTGATTDIFAVGTTSASYAAFGFTGMTVSDIQSAILTAVTADYLDYPTAGSNPLSPLPVGKELNINFVMASSAVAPANGDPEYYHVAIGTKTGTQSFLGQACVSCVRNASGAGPNFGVTTGMIVGSILVDNIAILAGLAGSNQERINLLAGTIAHEIGHALSLPHPSGAEANPGASSYSIMATGAAPTSMPNGERVKDRAFSYSEFQQLIDAIGLRDVTVVPEPGSLLLFAVGSVVVLLRQRRMPRA